MVEFTDVVVAHFLELVVLHYNSKIVVVKSLPHFTPHVRAPTLLHLAWNFFNATARLAAVCCLPDHKTLTLLETSPTCLAAQTPFAPMGSLYAVNRASAATAGLLLLERHAATAVQSRLDDAAKTPLLALITAGVRASGVSTPVGGSAINWARLVVALLGNKENRARIASMLCMADD